MSKITLHNQVVHLVHPSHAQLCDLNQFFSEKHIFLYDHIFEESASAYRWKS